MIKIAPNSDHISSHEDSCADAESCRTDVLGAYPSDTPDGVIQWRPDRCLPWNYPHRHNIPRSKDPEYYRSWNDTGPYRVANRKTFKNRLL